MRPGPALQTDPMKRKVLLDTDIGSDIDDALALAYLLAQPECELLGITTVSGEPQKRAELASALCVDAGRLDIPVVPGAPRSLVMPKERQPRCPQWEALGGRPRRRSFEGGGAVDFLRRTIRAHPGEVDLLAIGPLTNLALLFTLDPEVPSLLRGLWLMSGKFTEAHWAGYWEWNVMCDPHASEVVYRSRPPVFRAYGLDVTVQVKAGPEEVRKRFSAQPRLVPVLEWTEVWFREQKEVTFHDPLAAVAMFEPGVCGMVRGAVEVELAGAGEQGPGQTILTPAADGPVEVAATVEAARFFSAFYGVFPETGS